MTRPILEDSKGRDELNLAEFPITLLSDRAPKDMRELSFQDQIKDSSSDEWIDRKLTITASESLGLPTATDADVLVALIQHTRIMNGFQERRVPFSRYEILNLLRWNHDGYNYKRLGQSMRRWASVTLFFERSWRDKIGKRWVNKTFHIIDEVEANILTGRRKGDSEDLYSYFVWGEPIFESIQAGYIKPLDLDLYFSLESAIAKRLFRYLDKHFYSRSVIRRDMDSLAYEKLGLSRNYNCAQIRRVLQPAIQELEGIGFIEPLNEEERYEKQARGQYTVVFTQRTKHSLENLIQAPTINDSLIQRLTAHNMARDIAEKIVKHHKEEEIDLQLKVLAWKVEKDAKFINEPAGYLVKAISRKWPAPQQYLADQKKRVTDQSKQMDEHQRQQTNIQRILRRDQENAQVNSFWEGLSEKQQKDLMAKAIEESPEDLKSLLQEYTPTHCMYRMVRTQARDIHIRKMLGLSLED